MPSRVTIKLPWEAPPLRSNDRLHWAEKARVTKTVRRATAYLAACHEPVRAPVQVRLVWYVTDRRRRDASAPDPTLKAAQDGLVDAGLIPDDDARTVVRSWCEVQVGDEKRVELIVEEVE